MLCLARLQPPAPSRVCGFREPSVALSLCVSARARVDPTFTPRRKRQTPLGSCRPTLCPRPRCVTVVIPPRPHKTCCVWYRNHPRGAACLSQPRAPLLRVSSLQRRGLVSLCTCGAVGRLAHEASVVFVPFRAPLAPSVFVAPSKRTRETRTSYIPFFFLAPHFLRFALPFGGCSKNCNPQAYLSQPARSHQDPPHVSRTQLTRV